MFSGIVETRGLVKASQFEDGCLELSIAPEMVFDDLKIGDSVAVNGVCLTLTRLRETALYFTVVDETLGLTNLGALKVGSSVNLERALLGHQRNGGHTVQGHVDGVAEIKDIKTVGAAQLLCFKVPQALQKYIVKKGFVSLDGMSLTVVDMICDQLTVTLIPHTQAVTIAKDYRLGSLLNLEVDILSKYIEKLNGGSV